MLQKIQDSAKKTLNIMPHKLQIESAKLLSKGALLEIETGEGKTLTIAMGAILNKQLKNEKTVVVTANQYLSKRDYDWMLPLYKDQNILVKHIDDIQSKNDSWDVLYTTIEDIVNLFLKNRIARNPSAIFDIPFDNLILDEADIMLVDFAKERYILSYQIPTDLNTLKTAKDVSSKLSDKEHYLVDEEERKIVFTENGIQRIEKELNIDNLYSAKNYFWINAIEKSLAATRLFKKDIDYIVENNKIIMINPITKRPDKTKIFSGGLQQAIELKEKIENITPLTKPITEISYLAFLKKFKTLSGTSGTIYDYSGELSSVYGAEVKKIPTIKKRIRKDLKDSVFVTKELKIKALVSEVKARNNKQQPILIGTLSEKESVEIKEILEKNNISSKIILGENEKEEAKILKNAGQDGAVTIITAMSGRGTDIVSSHKDGLHVIGSQRGVTRRFDKQLSGRSGRQGMPGSSHFFVSLEDDLLTMIDTEIVKKISSGLKEDIGSGFLQKQIIKMQDKIEGVYAEQRSKIYEYDEVIEKQRNHFYSIRNKIVNDEIKIEDLLVVKTKEFINKYLFNEFDENVTAKQIQTFLNNELNISDVSKEKIKESFNSPENILLLFEKIFEFKNPFIEIEELRYILKNIYLDVMDFKWSEYIDEVQLFEKGVLLRSYGNKNPLLEFQKEMYHLYEALLESISYAFIQITYSKKLKE